MPVASKRRPLSRAEKWLFASPLLLLALVGGGAWLRDAFTLRLHDIAWAPDGTIWSAYRDTSVSVRDARTRTVLCTLGTSRDANSLSFALSPDGKTVAMQGASPTQIELRDAQDGRLLGRARAGYFVDPLFSPDGTLLQMEDGTSTTFFDTRTGKVRNILSDSGLWPHSVPRDHNTAFAVLNKDETVLDKIGVRDTRTGKWLRVWKSGGAALQSLAASRDGRFVAVASGGTLFEQSAPPDKITLFDARTGRTLRTLMGSGVFGRLAFSPDGTRLAAAPYQTSRVQVWDTATGRELFRVEHQGAHSFNLDSTVSLAWSPDGNSLATASADDTLRVWDGHNGTERPFAS